MTSPPLSERNGTDRFTLISFRICQAGGKRCFCPSNQTPPVLLQLPLEPHRRMHHKTSLYLPFAIPHLPPLPPKRHTYSHILFYATPIGLCCASRFCMGL